MRPHLILFVCALVLPLFEGTSLAQIRPNPVIVPLMTQDALISLDEIDPVDADAPIRLSFNFNAGFGNFRYKISFSGTPEDNTNLALIQNVQGSTFFDVMLDGNTTEKLAEEAPLPIVGSDGLYTFGIKPSDLIEPGIGRSDNRSLFVHLTSSGNFSDPMSTGSASWEFRYDVEAPVPPSISSVEPGERRLTVRWTNTSTSTDIDTVVVLVCPDAGVPSAEDCASLTALPCSDPESQTFDFDNRTDGSVGGDLRNEVLAAVAIRARDDFGNEGEISAIQCAAPRPSFDFYEAYRAEGGAEDGGFCFIATAAYGSYAHPMVRVLRGFRDLVLEATPIGSAFVKLYYRMSPPWADTIRQHPELATWARWGIVPIALLALVLMGLPLIGAGLVLWRLMHRVRRAWVAPAVLLVLLVAPDASAQRPDPTFETLGLGFEFRGGPYLPALAEATDGPEAWFADVHGRAQRGRNTVDSRPLFTLGAEAQLYRGFGTVAVGGSLGFMQFVGKAFEDLEGQVQTADTTVFNLLPLTLTAAYRFDWLVDNTFVPLVPYVRAGLAYYVWWSTDAVGDLTVYEDPLTGEDTSAVGGKLGVTGTLGISFLMNALEPRSAKSLYNATGIRATYLFAEVQANQVDGFGGDGFDFSDVTWNIGMFFEL